MQLNGPHTNHEHASVSLKVLLLIFGLILIAVLGYFVWLQNAEPDTTDNTAPKVKQEAITETTTDKTYTATDEADSSKQLYSFEYPTTYTVSHTANDKDATNDVTVTGSDGKELMHIGLFTDTAATSQGTTPEKYEARILATYLNGSSTSGYKAGSTTAKVGINTFYYFNTPEVALTNGAIVADSTTTTAVMFGKNGTYEITYKTADKTAVEKILTTLIER